MNSFLVAIFISETIVCAVIDCFVEIKGISAILMLFLLFINFFVNSVIRFTRLKKGILTVLLLEGILLLSGLLNGFSYVQSYAAYFCVFGFTALMLSFNDIDYKFVLSVIVIIYSIYNMLYFMTIRSQFLTSEDYYGQSMGIAYAETISIYILLLIIFYQNTFKLSHGITFLCIVNSLVSIFIIVIDCHSRGSVGCIMIAGIVYFLSRKKGIKKNMYLIVIVSAAMVAIYNFQSIIMAISRFLNQNGVTLGFIDKFIFLYKSGIGVGNGRELYYDKAWEAVRSSPLVGHGVGYFEKMVNGAYVHNIFLDLLVDFGIIGTLIALYLIFYVPMDHMLRERSKLSTGFVLFLLCSGELMLNFSSSFWLSPLFWYMFFFYLQMPKERGHYRIKIRRK